MALAEQFNKPPSDKVGDICSLLAQAFYKAAKATKSSWDQTILSAIPSPILENSNYQEPADDLSLPKSAEEFSLFYEQLVSYDALKKGGVFYTPSKIADLIIDESLNAVDKDLLKVKALLDPACGGGIFLIRAYKKLLELFDPKTALKLIHGIDRDPIAVEAARLSLILAAEESEQSPASLYSQLCSQVFSGNSLVSPKEGEGIIEAPFDWNDSFKLQSGEGFACIIGNPPYGLSRNEQISNIENELLKKLYAEFRVGKVNKYLLFIARSSQFLADGGVLSFIIPNSWLGIRSGSAIRDLLLNDLNLEEVSFFDGPIFPKASVETIIFRASKKKTSKHISLLNRSSENPKQINHQGSLTKSFCQNELSGRIPLIWEQKFEKILSKIYDSSVKLADADSGLKSFIALQAYAAGKGVPPQTKEQVASHCFHSNSKQTNDDYPYLEGSDIERYNIKQEKSYLSYGPWLAEPQKIQRFQGPRIAIREIINRGPYMLYAAYTDEAALYNKSVLHILPQRKLSPQIMLGLSGVLNSTTASLILFLTGRKTQRALFPKIVNADLLDFPIPKALLQAPEEMASLVRKIKGSETKGVQREIDILTAKLYGLQENIVQEIPDFLMKAQSLLLRRKKSAPKSISAKSLEKTRNQT